MIGRFFHWLVRTLIFRWIMTAAAVWVAWGIHSAFPEASWLYRTLLAVIVVMVLGWIVKPLVWGRRT